MSARSGLSVLFLVVASVGAAALLGACSASEKHDAPTDTPVSCEASNSCEAGAGTSLPPIIDEPLIANPCVTGKCMPDRGDSQVGPPEDTGSEAAVVIPDAAVVDSSSDASVLTDGGPG
jgi:hypothetical protein